MKKMNEKYVRDRDDLKLSICAIVLFAASAAILVYDVVTIVRGTVDTNRHLPFVIALALGALGGIVLAILRHGPRCPECRRNRSRWSHGYDDSYQHPDNRPRGRIDAPDGTSD